MNRKIHILLIEDDEDDVQLLRDTLVEKNVLHDLEVIGDGADAIFFFECDHNLPHIIVLDFNLPKIHGREVLKKYKQSKYSDIPLVVLSTSSAQEDIDFSYKNGAIKFLIKPNTRQGLVEVVDSIVQVITDGEKNK